MKKLPTKIRSFIIFNIILFSVFTYFYPVVISELQGDTLTRGHPRPDEVDLYGSNIWNSNTDVPAHNNLGFRIMSGASLTINAGVTIEFDPGTQLLVEGRLYIKGISGSNVILTSSSSAPTIGEWGGIKFQPGSLGYVNYTKITYSIFGVNLVGTTAVSVINSTIQDAQLGIKIENASSYSIIKDNKIHQCDAGVAIYDSIQNQIFDNEIYDIKYTIMTLSDNTNKNLIENNIMYSAGERGISLSGNANNNSFIQNSINTAVQEGIRTSDAPDNRFINNEIYSNENGGIFYSGSDRTFLKNNRVYENTNTGLLFQGANECTVNNNTISKNAYGLYLTGSNNIELNNVTISQSTSGDLDLSNNASAVLINCTFDDTLVFLHDTSKLWVYWYLILELYDQTGKLTGAQLRVYDAKINDIISKKSVSSGICWARCLGYTQEQSQTDYSMNPYWIETEKGEQSFKYGIDMSLRSLRLKIKFSPIPEILTIKEDTKLVLDLSDHFTELDGMDFDIKVTSGDNISYAFDEQNLILLATPPNDWNGKEEIEIISKPELGDTVKMTTTLNVTPINDPPKLIKKIPNQIKPEDALAWTKDLTDYFSDPDQPYGDIFTWLVSGVNRSLLNITFENNNMQIRINVENRYGNDEVTLFLKDQAEETVSQSLWINITPLNDPPEIRNIEILPKSGSPKTEFIFSINYYDIDGDQPDYILLKLNNKTTHQLVESDINDKDVTNGKLYSYTTKLTSQLYYFWFECHDGKGGYTTTKNMTGPIVSSVIKGSLSGKVTEKSTEKGLKNAVVYIRDLHNASKQITTTTNEDGEYLMIGLDPGINRYQVFASADGYKDSKLYNRTIIKGGISIQNIALERLPGDVVDTVIIDIGIKANRTNVIQHQAISFEAGAIDLDGDVLTFSWDFGDGTSDVLGKIVSHTYHDPGEYKIIMTVFDTDGNNISGSINITVEPSPYSNINGTTSDGSGDFISDNFYAIIFLIILIFIILLLTIVFLQLRRRNLEEEARIEAENRRILKHKKAMERRRRKREKAMEFVDREKRNVEQVNILISELHRNKGDKGKSRGTSKNRSKGKRKSTEKKKKKGKAKPRKVGPSESKIRKKSDVEFVIEDSDDVFVLEDGPKKGLKTKPKTKKKAK